MREKKRRIRNLTAIREFGDIELDADAHEEL
jgi:hypothetical protein